MKLNDEARVSISGTLVLLTGLPLLLFLLGLITRQTACWLFLPTAALVLVYLVAARFIRKDTDLRELRPAEAMSFRDFDSSEVDTVVRAPNLR